MTPVRNSYGKRTNEALFHGDARKVRIAWTPGIVLVSLQGKIRSMSPVQMLIYCSVSSSAQLKYFCTMEAGRDWRVYICS